MAPDAWGIENGYWDVGGNWHDADPATVRTLRVAMGGLPDVADPPPATRPVWFVRAGSGPTLQRPAVLRLEDGTDLHAREALPVDLPLGYHDLHPEDGGPVTRLIITPDRCHLADGARTWGWSVQLYATRSAASWGVGDLRDLRTLAEWSSDSGAGVLAVNPLHAARVVPTIEPSPYYPSSRLYRNPLYLRVEDVPGFDASDAALATAADAGRALNEQRLIDRGAVYELKTRALERLYSGFDDDPRFGRYIAKRGRSLRQFATYCALAEHHEGGWPSWPREHRRPDTPGVERFAANAAHRVRFHAWLQWLLDQQFADASDAIDLMGDLAVGVDPEGADAWVWQDVFAHGVRVGAPPDEFNTDGQDWGLPPFAPWRLRAAGYEPLVATLQASLRHCRSLRIDHVMGLFRLFWIPEGGRPGDGTYVRYPGTELLDIVALESVRAGATIVGEDLGTVEDEVRAHLRERAVLSYRVFWFEQGPPRTYHEHALAAVTTHDLPTIAGVWSGADEDEQRAIGLSPPAGGADALRSKLQAIAGVAPDAPCAEVAQATYAELSTAPSMLLTATLDDALCVEERPNLPGTTGERPNWSLALPKPIDDIVADKTVAAIAQTLTRRGG